MMTVRLVESPRNPVCLAALASLTCTSADPPFSVDAESAAGIVERVTASGHDSVLEHASFTFAVTGISRVTSHQLVRHRLASYSQQSQRYAGIFPGLVLPPSVLNAMDDQTVSDAVMAWDAALGDAVEALRRAGVPDEDVRYISPQGSRTALMVTMNLRELSHFCGLRRCARSQWEIRELADRMSYLVVDSFPTLAKLLGPQCDRLGRCPERKGCGRVLNLDDIGEGEE